MKPSTTNSAHTPANQGLNLVSKSLLRLNDHGIANKKDIINNGLMDYVLTSLTIPRLLSHCKAQILQLPHMMIEMRKAAQHNR